MMQGMDITRFSHCCSSVDLDPQKHGIHWTAVPNTCRKSSRLHAFFYCSSYRTFSSHQTLQQCFHGRFSGVLTPSPTNKPFDVFSVMVPISNKPGIYLHFIQAHFFHHLQVLRCTLFSRYPIKPFLYAKYNVALILPPFHPTSWR